MVPKSMKMGCRRASKKQGEKHARIYENMSPKEVPNGFQNRSKIFKKSTRKPLYAPMALQRGAGAPQELQNGALSINKTSKYVTNRLEMFEISIARCAWHGALRPTNPSTNVKKSIRNVTRFDSKNHTLLPRLHFRKTLTDKSQQADRQRCAQTYWHHISICVYHRLRLQIYIYIYIYICI